MKRNYWWFFVFLLAFGPALSGCDSIKEALSTDNDEVEEEEPTPPDEGGEKAEKKEAKKDEAKKDEAKKDEKKESRSDDARFANLEKDVAGLLRKDAAEGPMKCVSIETLEEVPLPSALDETGRPLDNVSCVREGAYKLHKAASARDDQQDASIMANSKAIEGLTARVDVLEKTMKEIQDAGPGLIKDAGLKSVEMMVVRVSKDGSRAIVAWPLSNGRFANIWVRVFDGEAPEAGKNLKRTWTSWYASRPQVVRDRVVVRETTRPVVASQQPRPQDITGTVNPL